MAHVLHFLITLSKYLPKVYIPMGAQACTELSRGATQIIAKSKPTKRTV